MIFSDAVNRFLSEKEAFRDLAPATVRSYRTQLGTFASFLSDTEIDLELALDRDVIAQYIHQIESRGYKRTTIYNKKLVLRMFRDWACERNLIRTELTIRIKKPARPVVVYLTPTEADRMKAVADTFSYTRYGILHLRDRVAFKLLCRTGISIQTMLKLSVTDYNRDTRTLRVGLATILLPDELVQVLNGYLDARAAPGMTTNHPIHGRLIASYAGNNWDKTRVRVAVKRHRQHCGMTPLAQGECTHPKYWSTKDCLLFLQTPVRSYDSLREQSQLVVGLGLYCGLRRAEMTGIKAQDVDLYQKKMHVLGKGSRRREIPLNEYMVKLLTPIVLTRSPKQTVLARRDGSRLSLKTVNKIVTQLARQAGLTYKRVTPHTLRHSFATHLKDAKVQIDVIQKLLGHSSISETERYIHTSEGDMREAVELLKG